MYYIVYEGLKIESNEPVYYPTYLSDLLEVTSHQRSQRPIHEFKLIISHHNTNTGHRSFSASACKNWNKLPNYLRTNTVTTIFKTDLKTHLFKAAYKLQ